MPEKLDLYNAAYARYEADVYRDARIETYGQDLGQTSWVTAQESSEIPRTLRLTKASYVLDVGCGSGRYALQVAETVECRVLGVDINKSGIRTANQLAAASKMPERAQFEICDLARPCVLATHSLTRFFPMMFCATFQGDPPCCVSCSACFDPGGDSCSAMPW